MSKVISPILTDGTGMAIAQAINHNTAVQLALNTASYDEDGTLLEVQDARTVGEQQYASLGEAIRAEVTRIDNEKEVQAEALEGHADRITAVENKANTNTTNIAKLNDRVNGLDTIHKSTIFSSVVTFQKNRLSKKGNVVSVELDFTVNSQVEAWGNLMEFPEGYRPIEDMNIITYNYTAQGFILFGIGKEGNSWFATKPTVGNRFMVSTTYLV